MAAWRYARYTPSIVRSGLLLVLVSLVALAVVVTWMALRPAGEDPSDSTSPARDGGDDAATEPPEPLREEPAVLIGRPMPPAPRGPTKASLEKLTQAEAAYRRAESLHADGLISRAELERARLERLEAEYDAGRIDARALHGRRAELLAAGLERLERLREAGMVPQDEVDRARLAVAYEEHLAGKPGERYGDIRRELLASQEERLRALVEAGVIPSADVERELEALARDFPAPGVPDSK